MKKGIPLGALWGFIIVLVYVASFIGIGTYLILDADYSTFKWKDYLAGGFKSLVYLISGIVIFIPILILSMYFVIRDSNLIFTFKRHWPLFLLGIYILFPNLPGPIDEAFVTVIAIGIDIMNKRWVTEQQEEVGSISRKQIE